ncbi:uncharacterized protein LOC130903621 [Diorhabda carinulata]|uniref:uncharacterized protein LOC130903621 n=1 Tax=Diorhabda carinulata TaxID=1163345 RepID=UPI0025A1C3C9|nr:uncharacterized protein LOC130903621 [Diorhabda carinulata]
MENGITMSKYFYIFILTLSICLFSFVVSTAQTENQNSDTANPDDASSEHIRVKIRKDVEEMIDKIPKLRSADLLTEDNVFVNLKPYLSKLDNQQMEQFKSKVQEVMRKVEKIMT